MNELRDSGNLFMNKEQIFMLPENNNNKPIT